MPYGQQATPGRKTSKYYIEEVNAQLESGVDDKLESTKSPAFTDVCSPSDSIEFTDYFGEGLGFGDPDQDLI